MRRLLLSFFVLQIVHCSCPPKFELVRDGECRGFSEEVRMRDDQVTNEAIVKCEEINGRPVTIRDDDDQSYWTSKVPESSSHRIILGLDCKTGSTKWQWSDGSAVDFRPAVDYDPVLDKNCVDGCAWYIGNNGIWGVWCNTDVGPFDVYCATSLQQPAPSGDGCDGFIDDSEDGVCYQIAAKAQNWKEAQTICHSFGAEVASVHSAQENSYIRRLAVSKGATNGILLGGKISGKGNDFGWIDGSDFDYNNFYPGFPIDGLGECLTMDTLTTAGQWMNTNCDSYLPVVCARPFNSDPEPVCSSSTWTEGQIIYSPGFPNNASVPCDYFLMVPAGKLVKLEILLLEANSCCDHLLITDGYVGGTIIANLTGEISGKYYYTTTSNVMRVSWQPNGGVNVRGLMMSFWTK